MISQCWLLLQDCCATAQWLAAASELLAHAAYLEPTQLQACTTPLWAGLAAVLDTSSVVARSATFRAELERLRATPRDALPGMLTPGRCNVQAAELDVQRGLYILASKSPCDLKDHTCLLSWTQRSTFQKK